MKKIGASLIVFAALALTAYAQIQTQLWQIDGQGNVTWDSRLQDFTDVGYKGGAEPIPDWPVDVDVTDFGAIPDDAIDDTQAFIDAIAACADYGAVFVPKGRYLITKRIKIERSHVVLRGEDMYKSVLFFPKYTSEIYIEQVGWRPDKTRNTAGGSFISLSGGEEKGIENLTLKFREQRKISPWEYIGANCMSIGGRNNWARNLYILNYDSGIGLYGEYNTLVNIIFDQFNGRQAVDNDQRGKLDAYSAIMPRNMNNNLMHNIKITGHNLQPIDNNESSSSSVYSRISTGEGNDRVVGLHGGRTTNHLYTELNRAVTRHDDMGDPLYGNFFNCTYWNINDEIRESAHTAADNRSIYVGYGDDFAFKSNSTFYYEPAAFGELTPGNLYLAQLEYLGKPVPEDFPTLPLKPYERPGDVLRLVPDDDAVPGAGATGTLQISSGAYFKFDLSQASETSVAAARLRLTMQSLNNAPYTLTAYSVSDDNWSETNLTTANKPAVGSQLSSQRLEADGKSLVAELDVTSFVRDELVGGDGVISLYVTYTQGNGYLPWAWSAEKGQKPELIIERVADSVPGAPSAPKGIRSTALVGNIVLDWDDNPESDVATYNVYRAPSADSWLPQSGGLITSDHVDVSSVDDWHVGMMDYRRVYRYWITAVDEHGYESEKSPEFVAAVVHPSNEPPVFNEGPLNLNKAISGIAYSDTLATKASDPESDTMYFMKVSGPDWLNVDLDGTLSGLPEDSDVGTSQFIFQVTAIGGSTQQAVNITVSFPPDDPPGAPAAPANLVAAVDLNMVSLEWDDNIEADLDGYTVYRSLTSKNYEEALATISPPSSVYVDNTAVNGTTYYYLVKAFDWIGNVSENSVEVSATPVETAPRAPTGLSATAGDSSVSLNWDDNAEGDLASYSVYRSTTSGGEYIEIATGVSTSEYLDSGVPNGTEYYYVVTATDTRSNESTQGAEASATPASINWGARLGEDFETLTAGGGSPPDGWTLVTVAGTPTYATTAGGQGSEGDGTSAGLAGKVSSSGFLGAPYTNLPGAYLVRNTDYDLTADLRVTFDFKIPHEDVYDDIIFVLGSIDDGVSTTSAGELLSTQIGENRGASITTGLGTGSDRIASTGITLQDDTWYRATVFWNPTVGTTGRLTVAVHNFSSEEYTIVTSSFTFDKALGQIGFGSLNDSIIFDNVTVEQGGGATYTAPVFTSDPSAATAATEDAAYSDSIAGSASDAEGDIL